MGLLADAWSGGLTGDEDTNVISEGVTSNEDTSITNLSGDEDTTVLTQNQADRYDTSDSGFVEGWLQTGRSREAFDYLWDYSEEWGGAGDQNDLVGPSIDPTASDDPDRGVIDYRNPDSAENDPTQPGNLPWWVWGILALVALALLADYSELVAKAA